MQILGFLTSGRAYSRTKAFMLTYKKTSIFGLICLISLIYYAHSIIYFHREFVFRINYNPNLRRPNTGAQTHTPIPRIIHHVFFNLSADKAKSDMFMRKYRPYQQTWIDMNPDHEYILWNDTMIDNLIDEHYPQFKRVYRKSHYKWNNRCDMARYLVIYHMGGVYADMDIECKESLNNLYKESGGKELLLNFTYNPVGVATDFFAASKKHNFMAHMLDGLDAADVPYLLPYIAAMSRAGPVYLLGRYLNYPYPEEIYWIPKATSLRMFDRTKFGQTWHELDGRIIHLFWTTIGLKRIAIVIFVIMCMYGLFKKYSPPPKKNGISYEEGSP